MAPINWLHDMVDTAGVSKLQIYISEVEHQVSDLKRQWLKFPGINQKAQNNDSKKHLLQNSNKLLQIMELCLLGLVVFESCNYNLEMSDVRYTKPIEIIY